MPRKGEKKKGDIEKSTYRKWGEKILSLILVVFAIIEYQSQGRPYLLPILGPYFLGAFESAVIMLAFFSIILTYLDSWQKVYNGLKKISS